MASITPDTWAMLVIAGAVLLANLANLLGIVDPNPLGPRSGLAVATTFGPAGGQPTIDPNNGFISQAVSQRAVLDLLHLHLPWWNRTRGRACRWPGGFRPRHSFRPTG